MKKTTVYLDAGQAGGLVRAASESGKSQAELIREAINEYLARRPKKPFRSLGMWDSGREGRTSIADEDFDAMLRAGLHPERGWH